VKSPILAIAAALLFFAASTSAQKEEQPLPKDLPSFGPEKPLQAPAVKVSKLNNGLTLWLVPQPGFPKVSFALAILGGYPADPKDHPGLSQLLSATIDQGTKTRTARQIAEQLQAAGGDLSANVVRDSIRITTGVLASKAADGLAILADIAQNATFPDSEVDIAKRNLSDSLDLQEADPNFLASRALARVLYGDSPYSVISPTKQSLAAMTSADLRAEFTRRARPDQALLVIVGDLSSDHMLALATEKFSTWRGPAVPVAEVPAPPLNPPPHSVFYVARPDSVQTTLALAAFGPKRSDPDFEAVEVANAIYGGTFGSRLTANIREDKGYTYTPGSSLQTFRTSGTLHTGADVRNAVTAPTLNEIFYEMNRLATTSPTDRELQQAKRYLVGIEAIQLQSRDAVAGELASLWTKNLPPEEIGAYGQKITAITAEQVDAAAKKYFPASRATIVAVGEEKVIRDSLSTFGLPITPAP
jgi:zinc protease